MQGNRDVVLEALLSSISEDELAYWENYKIEGLGNFYQDFGPVHSGNLTSHTFEHRG